MFRDRSEAGRRLAVKLASLRGLPAVVLALPRGGIPVGFEIARELGCPLDLVMVRKIGAPSQPELAVGAVVGGAVHDIVLNEDVIRSHGVSAEYIAREKARELAECDRRRMMYLVDRPPLPLAGRTAILVDDGIATGASIRAALLATRRAGPSKIVLATPVASPDVVARLTREADEIVTLIVSAAMASIGSFYRDFHQLDDDEVITLLAEADEMAPKLRAVQGRR